MALSRTLRVIITGDSAHLNAALGVSGGKLQTLGKVATGVAAGLGGLAAGGLKLVSAFQDADKVSRQTEAVLKSTGHAANISSKQVDTLSTALSRKAAVDDEAVKSGANLLLTFTNIRNAAGKGNDVFNQTTAAAVDMSAAMQNAGKSMSISDAALQLGKALNDPEKGMTRLTRVGVTFTEGQKKQVAAFMKAGQTAKAQGVILKELNKEFGGSAAAGATNINRLKVTVGNLAETIGGKLAPFVEKAAKIVDRFVRQMDSGRGTGGKFVTVMKGLGQTIVGVVGDVRSVVNWFGKHETVTTSLMAVTAGATAGFVTYKAAVTAVAVAQGVAAAASGGFATAFWAVNAALTANPVGVVIVALAALSAGFLVAYKRSETFRKAVDSVGSVLKTGLLFALKTTVFQLDLLAGGVSTMLHALGHVPGMGWATKAADSIDKARAATNKFVDSLNRVPKTKHVEVNLKLTGASLGNLFGRGTKGLPIPGNATGGLIPGSGNKDTVPRMLMPGEFVMRKAVVEKFGPTFFAGLNGGWGDPQAPGMSAGGIVSRANKLDAMHLPYLWGGGHSGGGINKAGMDCSGAVSYALGVSPRVSGQFTSFGLAGPGGPMDTKVYANAKHVFAVFNGQGWGTSAENPGGGPGWLSYNSRPGFTIRHLNDGGSKGSSATVGDSREQVEAGKARVTAGQEKAGSRLVNTIIGKTGRATAAATRQASTLGLAIDKADAGYGLTERQYGQVLGGVPGKYGDEDLGTAGGRAQRTTELQQLKKLKKDQLARMNKRKAALEKAISSRHRTLKALQKARDKAHGAKRAKMNARIKPYEDHTIELEAELAALGGQISNTELDSGDLDKEIGAVAATPDSAAQDAVQAAQDAMDKYVADRGSIAQSAQSLAQLTDDTGDDVAAMGLVINDASATYQEAVAKFGANSAEAAAAFVGLATALKSNEDLAKEIAQKQRDLIVKGFQDPIDALDAALVQAQVNTPNDPRDDIKVVTQQLADATAGYMDAVARGDSEAIKQFGSEVLSLRGSLESLQGALAANTSALADLAKEMAVNNAIAKSTVGIELATAYRALGDFISGQIGYKTTGRSLLAGDGSAARY